jgi:hypothetical protein
MHSLDLDDWTDYRQTLYFIQKPTFLEREIYLCLKYHSINDLSHAIVTNPGPEHSALPIADSNGDCYCSGASSLWQDKARAQFDGEITIMEQLFQNWSLIDNNQREREW